MLPFNQLVRLIRKQLKIQQRIIRSKCSKYWMQGLILIGLIYIITQRDIQVQLQFKDPIKEEIVTPKPPEKQKQYTNDVSIKNEIAAPVEQLAIVDPSALQAIYDLAKTTFGNGASEVTTPAIPAKEPVAQPKDIPNLLFVLNPTYVKRNGIDATIVNEKINNCLQYIRRFAPVALSEQKKYHIPASIKLAQALLESDAGSSGLSMKHNNHFGIKCFSTKCKKGHCTNVSDDSHKDFFRKFQTSWDSFRAHSLLIGGKRYNHLKTIPLTNYNEWAEGLQAAGYATDPNYAKKLIQIIETFQLDQLDR